MTEKKTFIITTEPITLYMDAESEEDAEKQFEDDKLGVLNYDDLVIAKIEENASVTYISDKPPTLKESYDIIGCRTVELLHCDKDGSQILIDEEGKLMSEEHWKINEKATIHWIKNTTRHYVHPRDVIVGNAIILSDKAVWT